MVSRRHERSYVRLPVNLVGILPSGRFEQMGSVLDISKGGLRVETGRSLSPGQMLDVFLRGITTPYASCRVVWTHTRGGALPSEAGLEIQGQPTADSPGQGSDFLAELRGVYHNPLGPS